MYEWNLMLLIGAIATLVFVIVVGKKMHMNIHYMVVWVLWAFLIIILSIFPSILDFIELSPDYSIMELRVLNEWNGKTLKELKLRSSYGINIMAIKRGDDIDISPKAEDRLSEDDIIVAIGSADDLSNLEDILIRKK